MVLAGGRSSRMGEDKAALMLDERRLAHIAADRLAASGCAPVLINSANQTLSHSNYTLVPDVLGQFEGPLAGILSGLLWVREHAPEASHLLCVPTDSPFFPTSLASELPALAETPATIVMATWQGKPEPAFALWPVALAEELGEWLETNQNRAIRAFAEARKTRYAEFADPTERTNPFFNINTPEDFRQAEQQLRISAVTPESNQMRD
jgi:molybdopterin-guanine dinucleotide biosynthesis protein A